MMMESPARHALKTVSHAIMRRNAETKFAKRRSHARHVRKTANLVAAWVPVTTTTRTSTATATTVVSNLGTVAQMPVRCVAYARPPHNHHDTDVLDRAAMTSPMI